MTESGSAPGQGRLRRAPDKRFAPTVVFLHHFGGNRGTTRRHQDMVLEMGFDCYSFNLSANVIPTFEGLRPRHLEAFRRGVIEHWAAELAAVLDGLEGRKILFSFSFPSVTVPALLGPRPRADVTAWICDGGPFIDMWPCMWNLFTYTRPELGVAKRLALTGVSYAAMGGPFYRLGVTGWMHGLDPGFPILSIRSGNDVLVPERAIDGFFAVNPRLRPRKLLLPDASHLEGLKQFPQIYKTAVADFLIHALDN
jgi:pimeloyl-ACP methyl ester carboxylesterase